MTTTKPQADPAAIEAALNELAVEVGADDHELPAGTQVRAAAPGDGRAFLEQFTSADELDRISRGGRPSMSGLGASPKRQVRLPAQLDAAQIARAEAEGRRPSDVLRAALTEYLAS